MAYNPFNIFRRNQKALFAVLTVFIMIMFTLSFGRGDLFDTLTSSLGGRSGEVVCRIDGRKITTGDLDGPRQSVQYKRVMANRFMYLAADEAANALLEATKYQRDKLSPHGKEVSDEATRAAEMLDPRVFPQSPQVAVFFLQRAEPKVANLLNAPNAKPEDKDVARMFQTLFLLRKTLLNAPPNHYFVNAPNRSQSDQIEFLLWEKKADQLGIKFSRDDVQKLIQKEFYNALQTQSDVRVQKALASSLPGFTKEACLDALASEFRVRTAQTVLLGESGRFHGAPVFTSPYEAYEFYRDKCSPSTYEVIAVPAAAFLDKVVGEPTETEINELYAKYANNEPDPKSPDPGFKIPRRISVAYIGITGEEPYYKKLAEEQIKMGEPMAVLSGALTAPLPGCGPLWFVGAAQPSTIKEPVVSAAYNAKVEEFKEQKRRNYEKYTFDPRSPFSTLEVFDPVLAPNAVNPTTIAATVGAMIGQTGPFGNKAAPTLGMTAMLKQEISQRISFGLPVTMMGFGATGSHQAMIGAAYVGAQKDPKPLPIEVYRPELMKDAIAKRAKALAFGDPTRNAHGDPMEKGDVARFIEELGKLSDKGKLKDKDKDRVAIEVFINEFVAERGLTIHHESTQPRDEWSLEEDPNLAPLVAAHKFAPPSFNPNQRDPYRPFGRSFFWQDDFTTRRRVPATGLYQAEQFPPERETAPGQPHYIVWRTDDLAPEKRDRVRARDDVRAAWKRLKARELAKKYAEDMKKAIEASGKNSDVTLNQPITEAFVALFGTVKDPKAMRQVHRFKIDNVAPLVPQTGVGLVPFGMPETNDIPYPTVEMATALVDNRDKGPGTTLVLPDAPKDTYYVAVLTRRDEKKPSDFKTDVYSFGMPPARDILRAFRIETIRRSRESVVELLKKEFRYEVTEEQKKKLEENAKAAANRSTFDE